MEPVLRIAWLSLALLHLPPAAVGFLPRLAERLYGVAPDGDLGVLIAHRGLLFAGVAAAALVAAFHPPSRRLATSVVGLSVVGFLVTYARAGMPEALRGIALADLVALVLLTLVTVAAFRPQAA